MVNTLSFLLNQLMLYGFSYLVFFFLGQLVQQGRLRVNYTRKIGGLGFFTAAVLVDGYFPRAIPAAGFISTLLVISFFLTITEPLRRRLSFLQSCYDAIARKEDAPYTVAWITIEFALQYVALQVCLYAYMVMGLPYWLILMNILIVAFGDGLAEPIGVRYGKHHYTTRALFDGRRYVRSMEGSLCVFTVSFLICSLFPGAFTPEQFPYALLLIPAAAALAEGLSPHTCDGPFIYLATTAAVLSIHLYI